MLRILILLTLTVQVFSLNGQNLVRNGSFEELSHCIDNCENPPVPAAIAEGWFSATLQSPDVYSPCNFFTLMQSACNAYYAPDNWKGYQYASEGNAGYGVGRHYF